MKVFTTNGDVLLISKPSKIVRSEFTKQVTDEMPKVFLNLQIIFFQSLNTRPRLMFHTKHSKRGLV